MLTFHDKLLVSILLSLSLSFFILIRYQSKGNVVNISVNGNELVRADINIDKKFSVKGVLGITEVEIKNRKVRVIDSPCGNKICVKTGWIDKPYQSIICIPNRVVVEIINNNKEIDAITK